MGLGLTLNQAGPQAGYRSRLFNLPLVVINLIQDGRFPSFEPPPPHPPVISSENSNPVDGGGGRPKRCRRQRRPRRRYGLARRRRVVADSEQVPLHLKDVSRAMLAGDVYALLLALGS